ncbi:linear amide C-N hydrolase [Marinomonas sp. CT5]|uniref:linear amide C-N hydrolase n=1 Tax=Marinomonas sp. CT5 TaxID=2066133 RepID=UPI001BB05DA0|nr:linear amide C-N hydrolase [Marinomonas sp. CT5]
MCTRILNNIDPNQVTVGRNLDWKFMLPAYLYRFVAGRYGVGISVEMMETLGVKDSQVLRWKAKYASIVTLVGEDSVGFGASDGMNSAGLVVNALLDTGASYDRSSLSQNEKALSVLRWAQFVLDCFANVHEVQHFFSNNDIRLIEESVPGAPDSKALLHLAVSDKKGHSLIIEVSDGLMSFYADDNYTVMTNQPSYPAQLQLMQYWLFQWDKSPEPNLSPVYTAPGGCSPTQRFERGCFYRYMHGENAEVDRLAQVRSMVTTCSTPLHCQLNEKQVPYTLWSNLSDTKTRTYYFQNTEALSLVWCTFDGESGVGGNSRLQVSTPNKPCTQLGLMNDKLLPCDDPFA